MAVPTPAAKPRGIRVRTTHRTEAEFITAFIDLCDDGSVFAPTEKMKPIGVDCAFSLELADGTAMVRGLGVIRNAWPTDDSPFGRPGIHITIDQLTTGTEPIFAKLLEARKATAHKPRARPAPSTHQLWGPPSGPPTEEMNVVEVEEPEVQELPHKITKELKSPTPPEDLTHEAFIEDPATGKPKRAGTIPNLAPIAPVQYPRLASAPIVPIPSSAVEDDAGALTPPKPWWMNARVGGVFAAGIALGLLMSLVFGGGDDGGTKVTASAAPAVVAKAEPAQCPPPPEPTAVAAAEPVEAIEPPPAETKARTAKTKQVAVASPGPKKVAAKKKASSIETETAAAIKPTAFASIKAATTPSSKTATTSTKTTTAKAVTTTTKPTSATTKATVAATKPATTTKPTKVATTKPAKPKKGACSSLDCL